MLGASEGEINPKEQLIPLCKCFQKQSISMKSAKLKIIRDLDTK